MVLFNPLKSLLESNMPFSSSSADGESVNSTRELADYYLLWYWKSVCQYILSICMQASANMVYGTAFVQLLWFGRGSLGPDFEMDVEGWPLYAVSLVWSYSCTIPELRLWSYMIVLSYSKWLIMWRINSFVDSFDNSLGICHSVCSVVLVILFITGNLVSCPAMETLNSVWSIISIDSDFVMQVDENLTNAVELLSDSSTISFQRLRISYNEADTQREYSGL